MKKVTRPRGRRRRARIILGVGVVLLAVAIVPFGWQLVSTSGHRYSMDDVPDRPVGLVLGAGVRPDGRPSFLLAQRLDMAAELYRDGRLRAVLVSGDNGTAEYNETDTMRDYLIDAGVPADRVVGDHAGFSTWDSCARARDIFSADGAIVLTQRFHLPRAVKLCRAAGIDAVGVGGDSMRERRAATIQGWIREVPAAIPALATTVLRPDPTVLGDVETSLDDALARSTSADES